MPLTRPLTDNPDFEKLSFKAQNLYYRLRDKIDDFAFLPSGAQFLANTLYPHRDDMRPSEISALVAELRQSGFVRETNNHRGHPVVHCPGCEQKGKKSMKSEHVPPEEHNQLFLPTPVPKEVQKKEGRKEKRARADVLEAVDLKVELPPGFPATPDDAIQRGYAIGCPGDFILDVWNKAMSRLGNDAKGHPIGSFVHYLAREWSYEKQRIGISKNGTSQQNNRKRIDLGQGTANDGKTDQYDGVGKVV